MTFTIQPTIDSGGADGEPIAQETLEIALLE